SSCVSFFVSHAWATFARPTPRALGPRFCTVHVVPQQVRSRLRCEPALMEIAVSPRERRASPGVGPRCERRALRPASAVEAHELKEPSSMVRKLSIVAAGLLIGTTALGYAQSSTQDRAPGQRMQERGSVPGHHGASGYAPGQRMHERGSKAGEPGASGYAPGR